MFHNNVHLSAEVQEGPGAGGAGRGAAGGDEDEGGEESQGGDRAVGRAHIKWGHGAGTADTASSVEQWAPL